MRRFLVLPLLLGLGSMAACSETDATSDDAVGGAGQAGQTGNTAGKGGGGASGNGGASGAGGASGDGVTEPPLESDGGAAGATADSSGAGASSAGASGEGGSAGADSKADGLTSSPLPLFPAFSPSITDYYVRCADGENALTFTMTNAGERTSTDVTLLPNEVTTVAERYWVRCLPPDFPAMTVAARGTPTPGYYLANSTSYAMVLDTHGVPVWYAHGAAMINVDSPAVDTLTLMPNFAASFGLGPVSNFEIRELATGLVTVLSAAPGEQTDAHELRILPNGNHLLFSTPAQTGVDLTGLSSLGNDETIMGCLIEELDPSNQLVWSWNATDHVDPVQETREAVAQTVGSVSLTDVFHCNAIDVDSSGNLLLSMRHTNSLFYIDRQTGKVLWKLGGSAYNKDGAALIQTQNDVQDTFTMQHDARFRPNGNVTLFDDHGTGNGVARGVEYGLDLDAGVATPVFQVLGSVAAGYEGSFRRYDDGESVVGWGYMPGDPRFLSEFDADGNDVLDMSFDDAEVNYRSVKVPLSQFNLDTLRATAGK